MHMIVLLFDLQVKAPKQSSRDVPRTRLLKDYSSKVIFQRRWKKNAKHNKESTIEKAREQTKDQRKETWRVEAVESGQKRLPCVDVL